MDTGEYAAAQEVLAAALEDTPDDADLRYALGETLRRRGDRVAAIRMLETLRVRFPRAPRVLISLRELYRDSERWGDAADVQAVYFDTLAQAARAGEHERLIELRYQAALALPEATDRLAALDAVVAQERDFVPGLVSLGDALADAGRTDEAMKLWEKAFRSHPRLVFVERLLAHERSAREHERVMALLGKHWNEVEGDGAHLLLARSALATGAFDTAERELRAVAAQDAPTTLRAWAELHHQRGDHAAAWSAATRGADHTCTVCRRVAETWVGYCPGCGRFDTYRAGGER
jgi:tetratricopeptide (TPR) repeat protein